MAARSPVSCNALALATRTIQLTYSRFRPYYAVLIAATRMCLLALEHNLIDGRRSTLTVVVWSRADGKKFDTRRSSMFTTQERYARSIGRYLELSDIHQRPKSSNMRVSASTSCARSTSPATERSVSRAARDEGRNRADR